MKKNKSFIALALLGGAFLFIAGVLFFNGRYKGITEIPDNNSKRRISSIEWKPPSKDAFNILLLGGDRVYNNTDTIILANIDTSNNILSLLSIPRDTRVKIEGNTRKINFAYPRGGPELAVKTVESLLDTSISNYVFIDLSVFRKTVDLLGGVYYYVPSNMRYDDPSQELYINLEKGWQVLDGKKAEYLVRYRRGYIDGDLGRIKVQQDFIKETIKQKLTISNIPRLRKIAVMLFENLSTDLTIDKIFELLKIAPGIDYTDIGFYRLPGVTIEQNWYFMHDRLKTSHLIETMFSE